MRAFLLALVALLSTAAAFAPAVRSFHHEQRSVTTRTGGTRGNVPCASALRPTSGTDRTAPS
eukprot:CAMPEP_0119533994 /NCGR_PEP_ID=MMETSP1344-20130328/47298_1 /TAXON_ID=236787 /ORGANISM="Florenciella parvula, Strain CCMP2471" /LENGTH=61 /DNA_ID=CAMNT_0007575085 /DNA_START=1 /DNA_END=182 /DNA_ORIENTATION=+